MWKQIIIGLMVSWLGWIMIMFSQQIVDMFGQVAWAENNLSSTRNMYVLWWFVIIVFGMLMLFGVIPVDWQVDWVMSM